MQRNTPTFGSQQAQARSWHLPGTHEPRSPHSTREAQARPCRPPGNLAHRPGRPDAWQGSPVPAAAPAPRGAPRVRFQRGRRQDGRDGPRCSWTFHINLLIHPSRWHKCGACGWAGRGQGTWLTRKSLLSTLPLHPHPWLCGDHLALSTCLPGPAPPAPPASWARGCALPVSDPRVF